MSLAARSRVLRILNRRLLPITHTPPPQLPLLPVPLGRVPSRRQSWWTPPEDDGPPQGHGRRWVTPTTYEYTEDMEELSGVVTYDTSVGPRGDIYITVKWGNGHVSHLTHTLPPGVDPATVQTTLSDDGVIKITATLR